MANSRATVPFETATAYFLSKYFARSSSNLLTVLLVPEISFFFKFKIIAIRFLIDILGSNTLINLLKVFFI